MKRQKEEGEVQRLNKRTSTSHSILLFSPLHSFPSPLFPPYSLPSLLLIVIISFIFDVRPSTATIEPGTSVDFEISGATSIPGKVVERLVVTTTIDKNTKTTNYAAVSAEFANPLLKFSSSILNFFWAYVPNVSPRVMVLFYYYTLILFFTIILLFISFIFSCATCLFYWAFKREYDKNRKYRKLVIIKKVIIL